MREKSANNFHLGSGDSDQIAFFFRAGVKGGPLFDLTRAWLHFLRYIVAVMKLGYEDGGGGNSVHGGSGRKKISSTSSNSSDS